MIKIVIKLGKHNLRVKEKPDIIIDEEKAIMSIVLLVETEDKKLYELHYFSAMDDPDLIVYSKENTFLDELK